MCKKHTISINNAAIAAKYLHGLRMCHTFFFEYSGNSKNCQLKLSYFSKKTQYFRDRKLSQRGYSLKSAKAQKIFTDFK